MTDHGHAPDSLYQRDDRADIALGRLLRALTWLLIGAVAVVLFLTPDHTWGALHWVVAIVNATVALYLALKD